MQIRAAIALQAVIKSMTDAVLPGIDSDNRLAQEQGRLVVGLLTLIADRLPLQHAYDLDELRRLCALGGELLTIEADAQIGVALQRGREVMVRAAAAPADLHEAIGALTAAIGERAQALAAATSDSSRGGCLAILIAAREQQLRERSWLLMQGWEIHPAAIPPIQQLIGTGRGASP